MQGKASGNRSKAKLDGYIVRFVAFESGEIGKAQSQAMVISLSYFLPSSANPIVPFLPQRKSYQHRSFGLANMLSYRNSRKIRQANFFVG